MLTNFQTKYKVQCKIGEGSFSEVVKCQNRETGQLFAAKRLKKSFQNIIDAVEIPEVIAMKKLPQHPHILHLIESHFEPEIGRVTLVFDLMEMSMYDMMKTRKRPLPEARVKNYLYQILKGVSHLHSHGVFHRDIKPENILIKGEVIKIADLGSVRGIYSRRPYTEYISTRWYRSPECLLTSGYYGPKMDVWAIGCVFYELLTLKPLFPGSNELDQISKIHTILGTPSQTLINRFRKHKSQHSDISFAPKAGSGFGVLLQNISEGGRDILKMMLIYDPKVRSATRRLLENRYFNDLREHDLLKRRLISVSSTSTVSSNNEWRNPVLLSFMTSERKRKQKQINAMNSKVPRPIHNFALPKQRSSPSNNINNPQKLKETKVCPKLHLSRTMVYKATNKNESKLIKRDTIHKKIPQAVQNSPHVLQETTNIFLAPPTTVLENSSCKMQSSSNGLRNNFTASTSFLPLLAEKQTTTMKPLLRKNSTIPSHNIPPRQFLSKPYLPTNKPQPRLEPIMEHIAPKSYKSYKFIQNSQGYEA